MALKQSFGLLSLNACMSCERAISSSAIVWNSNRGSITRIQRKAYMRTYPTLLVRPDGSSIKIRYSEPRKLIQMPIDLSTLSEEERLARIARRKPKKKVIVVEEVEDTYDANQYSHLWKK